jgi:hypothetical protein
VAFGTGFASDGDARPKTTEGELMSDKRSSASVISAFLMSFVAVIGIGIFLLGFFGANEIDLGVGLQESNATTNMATGGLVMLLVLLAVVVLWVASLRQSFRLRRRLRELEQRPRR